MRLRAADAELGEQAGIDAGIEAIAERARDRHAETRRRRRDAQVAGGGDRAGRRRRTSRPPRRPSASAGSRAPRRSGDLLLVRYAFVGVEIAKLRDVGAGDEGLAAGPGESRGADVAVGAQPRADGLELLVHRPGHGVVRLRAVEGDARRLRRRWSHGRALVRRRNLFTHFGSLPRAATAPCAAPIRRSPAAPARAPRRGRPSDAVRRFPASRKADRCR